MAEDAASRYRETVDRLRMVREKAERGEITKREEQDAESEIIDELDALSAQMTTEERKAAEKDWWRAWPDEYRKRTAEGT